MPRFAFDPDEFHRRRLAADLPQEYLALAVGRTAASVADYERGRTAPPIPVLWKLCEVLGCTPNDLVRPVDEPAVEVAS
jgi:transcriptional regulator with XRE-family HTH domain